MTKVTFPPLEKKRGSSPSAVSKNNFFIKKKDRESIWIVSKDFFLKTNGRKRKKERAFEEIKIIIFVNHFEKENQEITVLWSDDSGRPKQCR